MTLNGDSVLPWHVVDVHTHRERERERERETLAVVVSGVVDVTAWSDV